MVTTRIGSPSLPPRAFSVRRWLTLLLVTCVLPVWGGAIWALEHAADAKRDLVQIQLLHSARILSLAMDNKIGAIRAGLRALASSPALDSADFRVFHQQARLLIRDFPDSDIILSDRDGNQVVNSFLPYGVPLPKRSVPETVARVFASGEPALRPHFKGALTGRSLIGIDAPVLRNGQVVFDLGITLPCQTFTTLLEQSGLPPGWAATFIDTTGTTIARNMEADHFVGEKMDEPPGIGERISEIQDQGGHANWQAEVVSAESGWAVHVSVPTDLIATEIRAWRAWMLACVTGLTFLGALVAFAIGNRIARAIESLVEPAIRLGQGEVVEAPATGILETVKVAEALSDASALLTRHRKELKDSDRRERMSQILATTDALTELPNRRRFDDLLTQEHARHTRAGAELSLILLDVDNFKAYNDTYGHVAGDECLRQVARVIEVVVARAGDFAARYGGEEFACVLPMTDFAGALMIAEKIRRGVSDLMMAHRQSAAADHVTVSLGVVTAACHADGSATELVAMADKQLYAAKSSGRNCVRAIHGHTPGDHSGERRASRS